MTHTTDLATLRRCRWHATADLLSDAGKAAARARVLLSLPVYLHTPIDKRALLALRRIARGGK